jgi:hypothetical protein
MISPTAGTFRLISYPCCQEVTLERRFVQCQSVFSHFSAYHFITIVVELVVLSYLRVTRDLLREFLANCFKSFFV